MALAGRSYRHSGGGAGLLAPLNLNRLMMRRALCRPPARTAPRVSERDDRQETQTSDGYARGTRTGHYRRHDRAANQQSARALR
jgi:hypothetical protein